MVGRLAERLLRRYAYDCENLLDPFCGSGEILVRGAEKGLAVTGYDVNPFATLFARVRLEGFDEVRAFKLLAEFLRISHSEHDLISIAWPNKEYWFSPATLARYECLRSAASGLELRASREGRSVLLAYALSARICSRADERSPKPFISKAAVAQKYRRHINPLKIIPAIHHELSCLYGRPLSNAARVVTCDVADRGLSPIKGERFSHVITSPPYLNAQDYFRNFKLELFLLEGILDFRVSDLIHTFIGTERGDLLGRLTLTDLEQNREVLPEVEKLERDQPKHASVVHRYLFDMRMAFENIQCRLKNEGVLVLVCGDNLVASLRVRTWRALNSILESMGFHRFSGFKDTIRSRALPPKRSWHKSMIKEERVTAFRLNGYGKR